MTRKTSLSDLELDDLFADAQTFGPGVSSVLFQRIVGDADAVLDQMNVDQEQSASRQPAVLQSLLGIIGGWPAMAGLATATMAGIWIGFSPPTALDSVAGGYLSSATYYDLGDFMPSVVGSLGEG